MLTTTPSPASPSASASPPSRSASTSARRREEQRRRRDERRKAEVERTLADHRASAQEQLAAGRPIHEIPDADEARDPRSEPVFGCQTWRREWAAEHERSQAYPTHTIVGLAPDDTVLAVEVCRLCGSGYGDRDRLESVGGTVLICAGCGRSRGE